MSQRLNSSLKKKMLKNDDDNSSYDSFLRENYLVVQANDLAKAFGNLSLMEHRLLDYLDSFVTKNSKPTDVYTCYEKDIIKYYNWSNSGKYYKYIKNCLTNLQKKSQIFLKQKQKIRSIGLLEFVDFYKSGQIKFKFSPSITPYLVNLKENYFYLKLSDLADISSKYTLIFIKIWESNRHGNSNFATISGSLDDWEDWFLGHNKRWGAGQFKQKVLNVSLNEINEKFDLNKFRIITKKHGRKITGYEITLNGSPKYYKTPKSDMDKKNNQNNKNDNNTITYNDGSNHVILSDD